MSTALVKTSSKNVKNIAYGDLFAQLFLWQKAITLIPIWAMIFVPIFGFLCRAAGPLPTQLGYGLVLVLGLNYFLEDLLKRRIRLDDEYIFFGFRSIRIADIATVDLKYKKRRLLPTALVLTTLSGQNVRFSLGGISETNVELLLKHLQARNSNLKTSPVITTLVKCRKISPKPVLDIDDKLAVPYHAGQLIDESIDTFKLTAQKWMRLGPLVASVVLTPVWMMFLSTLYVCLTSNSFYQVRALNLNAFGGKVIVGMQQQLFDQVSSVGTTIATTSGNPIAALASIAAVGLLFLYIASLFVRPNVLLCDKNGISLALSLGQISIPMGSVRWSEIVRAELHKARGRFASAATVMKLSKSNGKSFQLNLASIAPENQSRLLKRMEKFISNSEIDTALSQAMVPRAERSYTEIWLQSLTQAPERKTLDPLSPGQVVCDERFEVLKTLGVGGQGTAYLCRDLVSKDADTVVLKETILPIFVDDGVRRNALERFEQEARMLKAIDSDGIVKLLDYFIEDHRAYLVLEHIDGSTLRDLIERVGPVDEKQAHDLALQMSQLLQKLHANKIVHRDFTPDNLILNSKGKLKLIDFNVAQQIQEGSAGTIVGKHAYLPPEQFRGKATSQSDLYAFGATLFFLLTGKDPEPISQSLPSAISRIGQDQPVSTAFDDVVKKATALQVNKRYENAQQIESDLLSISFDDLHDGEKLFVKSRQQEGVVEHG